MSLLLAAKIFELFLILLAGYAIVRLGALKPSDAHTLSIITLYLITPAALITSFEVDLTPELGLSLALVTLVGLVANFALYGLGWIFAHLTGASVVEQASVTYCNAGNLILPIVTSVLGEQYVIYTVGFMVVQNIMFWTLLDKLFSGQAHISVRKVLTNANIIAIFVGLFLLTTGLRLPLLVDNSARSLASMLGPASMLIVGMTLAGMDLKTLAGHKLAPAVVLVKMVISPLILITIFKLSGIATLVPDGERIFMVPMLAVMSCTATTVTQFAQLHNREPEYASVLVVLTTLSCLITMPLMVQYYLM